MSYIGKNPDFNTSTLNPLAADPVNPVEGMVFYADGTVRAEGLYVFRNGAFQPVGSGTSGINHVENSTFESGVTDYNAYADTASVRPIDGTGGSPNITFTANTATPLRGVTSGRLSKDAANRQGQGVSVDFTTELADQFSVQSIEFDYAVSANFEDGDARVYIYDITNNVVIEPVPTEVLASSSSSNFKAYFQTSDSTSYRLILHIASTNASAYTVDIDEVRVGPAVRAFGPVVQDEQSYTPVIIGFGAVTNIDVRFRRVGDAIQIEGRFTAGTPTADLASISLPPGVSVANLANGGRFNVGNYIRGDVSTAHGGPLLVVDPSPTVLRFGNSATFGAASIDPTNEQLGSNIISPSNFIYFQTGLIKVTGWSSSQQISDDAETRIVAIDYSGNAGDSITADVTDIPFATENKDTHSAWNGTQFTAPSSGVYPIKTSVKLSSAQVGTLRLFVNGTFNRRISVSVNDSTFLGSVSVFLEKGDVASIRSDTSFSLSNVAAEHYITISRVSGPAQIAANELIACSYSTTSGQTVNNGNTIIFDSLNFDTHNAYNTTTGIFTCPASGKYFVNLVLNFSGVNVDQGNTLAARVFVNANFTNLLDFYKAQVTVNTNPMLVGGTLLQLNKGDQVDLRLFETVVASLSVSTDSTFPSNFSIERIGF